MGWASPRDGHLGAGAQHLHPTGLCFFPSLPPVISLVFEQSELGGGFITATSRSSSGALMGDEGKELEVGISET